MPNTHENPVRSINASAQTLIRQTNPDSVYQYYQLVNVIWNDSTVDENAGKALPVNGLSDTAFRPDPNAFHVSNAVLETYIQSTSCVNCHSGATIAKSPLDHAPTFASDYSFVIGLAGPAPEKK